MLRQLDLNVAKPESERLRLPALYLGDSINMANLRIYFREEDAAKVLQLLKDKMIMPALWNVVPVNCHYPLRKFIWQRVVEFFSPKPRLDMFGKPK